MATVTLERFQNDTGVQATLSASITNSDTTLTVSSAANFPSAGVFRIRIENEVIVVGAVSGTTLSSLTRGAEGTTAASHSGGVNVDHVLTKGAMQRYTPDHVPQPRQRGVLAWTMAPEVAGGFSTGSQIQGIPQYARAYFPDPEPVTIGSVCWHIGASDGTVANVFLAVYNAAGTRLGLTANQATASQTLGYKTATLTQDAGQSLTIAGGQDVYVWIGFVAGTVASGTQFLARGAAGDAALPNLQQTSPPTFGSSGTAQTTLPTSITPGSLGVGRAIFVAVF